jgi:hypothetical protein
VSHGGRADRSPGEGLAERGVQGGAADLVKQPQQAGGLAGERLAAEREGLEERVGVSARGAEAIATAQVMGPALLLGQGRQVRVVFDALAPIVAARMVRDVGAPVKGPARRVRRRRG